MLIVTAEDLKKWRTATNRTLEDVGSMLGVTPPTVGRWEADQKIPGPAQILLNWYINGVPQTGEAGGTPLLQKSMWRVKMDLQAWEELESLRIAEGFGSVTDFIGSLVQDALQTNRGGKTLPFPAPEEEEETPYSKAAEEAVDDGVDLRTVDTLFEIFDLSTLAKDATVPLSVIRQFIRGEQALDGVALVRLCKAFTQKRDEERLLALNTELTERLKTSPSAGWGRLPNPSSSPTDTQEGTGDGLPAPATP